MDSGCRCCRYHKSREPEKNVAVVAEGIVVIVTEVIFICTGDIIPLTTRMIGTADNDIYLVNFSYTGLGISMSTLTRYRGHIPPRCKIPKQQNIYLT